jgi:hypothetical protein
MYNYRHPPASETTTTNEIEPLFERTETTLTIIQRSSIITLYLQGYDANYISTHIPCNIHTVYH